MGYKQGNICFMQSSMTHRDDNTSKVRPKRKHVKDSARVMVGTRLTDEQVTKLDMLVGYYTLVTGVQATRASVIADLIDMAEV